MNSFFLELKTTDTSFDDDQVKVYLDLRDTINTNKKCNGALFLYEKVEEIQCGSKEKEKYQTVLDKLKPHKSELEKCTKAKVIYLVPKETKERMDKMQGNDKVDHVFCFSDLPEKIHSKFHQEWKIIRKHLITLD